MSHAQGYYIPHGSHWPVVGSLGLLFTMVGTANWLNGADVGMFVMLFGVGTVVYMVFGWFATVIHESLGGSYNRQVDVSFLPHGRSVNRSAQVLSGRRFLSQQFPVEPTRQCICRCYSMSAWRVVSAHFEEASHWSRPVKSRI